jgi:hypothetical protein
LTTIVARALPVALKLVKKKRQHQRQIEIVSSTTITIVASRGGVAVMPRGACAGEVAPCCRGDAWRMSRRGRAVISRGRRAARGPRRAQNERVADAARVKRAAPESSTLHVPTTAPSGCFTTRCASVPRSSAML